MDFSKIINYNKNYIYKIDMIFYLLYTGFMVWMDYVTFETHEKICQNRALFITWVFGVFTSGTRSQTLLARPKILGHDNTRLINQPQKAYFCNKRSIIFLYVHNRVHVVSIALSNPIQIKIGLHVVYRLTRTYSQADSGFNDWLNWIKSISATLVI